MDLLGRQLISLKDEQADCQRLSHEFSPLGRISNNKIASSWIHIQSMPYIALPRQDDRRNDTIGFILLTRERMYLHCHYPYVLFASKEREKLCTF